MKKIAKIAAVCAVFGLALFAAGCGNSSDTPYVPSDGGSGKTLGPLTLEFTAAGTITFTNKPASLKYSKNGAKKQAAGDEITVVVGDKICLYANGTANTNAKQFNIACDADCYVYGNVMSLISSSNYKTLVTLKGHDYAFFKLFYENTHIKNHPFNEIKLPAATLVAFCYNSMFYGCVGLTSAPALPATTLAQSCYAGMFSGCAALEIAPDLPALTLANSCYEYMFNGCAGLKAVPALPATTLDECCYSYMFKECTGLKIAPENLLPAENLAKNCYQFMFDSCEALETAPDLPAKTLTDYCYYGMFQSCKALKTAPELPATTLAANCYYGMFQSCAALVNAPELPATTLAKGCYQTMFASCAALETAPDLPAATLEENCYMNMFADCSKLKYIKCLATYIDASGCTHDWVNNVNTGAAGTFVRPEAMQSVWIGRVSGSGIPSGWNTLDS